MVQTKPTISLEANTERTITGTRWYVLMVGLGLLVAAAISPLHRGITGDALWHLTDGRWILAHHQIPRINPFGWSTGNTPWINLEWGWDVVTAAMVKVFGWSGLLLWLGSTMAIVAWAQRMRWQALKVSPLAQGDWIFLTLIGIATFWAWRPQLVSYAMIPLWLWTLESAEHNTQRLWWLVPQLIVWESLHGGYLLGLLVLILWLGHRLWPSSRPMHRMDWYHIGAVLGLLGLALGLTPWGWDDIAHAVWETQNPVIAATISEWQSPNFHRLWWIAVLGLPTLAVALRVWLYPESRQRVSRFHWIVWAVLLGGTLMAVRNYPFFVEQTAIVGAGIGLWQPQKRVPPIPRWIVGGILGITAVGIIPFARMWLTVHPGVPQPVIAQLKQQPGRVLNGYRVGDGLVYEGIPDSLDGRTDLFIAANHWFQSSLNAENGVYPWSALRQWMAREHVRYVLWPTTRAGTQELLGRSGVEVLYHSKQLTLFQLQN